VVKAVLKWKKVDDEVIKKFQSCSQLANLVYGEMDRIMLDNYIVEELSIDLCDDSDDRDLAVFMADGYPKWLQKQIESSDDWLRRFCCNYIYLMELFSVYKLSVVVLRMLRIGQRIRNISGEHMIIRPSISQRKGRSWQRQKRQMWNVRQNRGGVA
jgi:hypothetical protein